MRPMDPRHVVDPTWGPSSQPPSIEDPEIAKIHAGKRRSFVVLLVIVAVAALAGAGFFVYAKLRDRAVRNAPMVKVPAAAIQIGSDSSYENERPEHTVTVRAFEIDVTEVTVRAFRLCVNAGACTAPEKDTYCNYGVVDRDDHPVNCVTWTQANAFCAWAKKRLPTEEEWEYAARGTDGRIFPWGNDMPGPKLANVADLDTKKHFLENEGHVVQAMHYESDGWATTAKVGSFPAGKSPFGAMDMAGNVVEWTSSAHCPYTEPACGDENRVARGGAWLNALSWSVRATARFHEPPDHATDQMGFRCARGE
jgi:sulfatase modifying factor 1